MNRPKRAPVAALLGLLASTALGCASKEPPVPTPEEAAQQPTVSKPEPGSSLQNSLPN